jgi:hypothetical protein
MAQEPTSAPKLDPAATDETSANARQGTRKRRDPHEPAAVIGIGASAGGIAPLQQFFADMKPDTGLAFVVVMHLSPDFESELANVIGQKTTMPVTQVTEAVKVQPNHVYVIPPNHHLTFRDSMLELVPPQQQLGRRVTIDLFFRTLAQAYGQRAVCVIMSGSDSDGAIGLKHIRAQGGLTIAQNPHEAQFDSMPATAISTGMVDWVLPVAEMPAKLVEFVTNEHRMKLPPEVPEAEDDVKVAQAPGGETVSDVTRATEDEDAIGKVLADLARADRPRFQPLQTCHHPAPHRTPSSGELARDDPAVCRIFAHAHYRSRRAPAGPAHRCHALLPGPGGVCRARSPRPAALRRQEER